MRNSKTLEFMNNLNEKINKDNNKKIIIILYKILINILFIKKIYNIFIKHSRNSIKPYLN